MRPQSSRYALSCLLLTTVLSAQLQMHKVTEPAGKTLDKALKTSLVIQPDAKPFHVKLEITQPKTSSTEYAASIEENWVSPTQWTRTVSAPGLKETTVVNLTGTHFLASGEYFPSWLRGFIIGFFTEVQDPEKWNTSSQVLEHIELSNGGRSDPCMHADFMLGIAPIQQVNFSNVCFKDGLLSSFGSPSNFMEFRDYKRFGKLKVARTLSNGGSPGVELVGKVTLLEELKAPPTSWDTPPGATDIDPFSEIQASTQQLYDLAGGPINPRWPTPIPGRGMFTVWVSLDKAGIVREVHPLNSDESGFAREMAGTLKGLRWKSMVVNGLPVQTEGPLVFTYPPPPDHQ